MSITSFIIGIVNPLKPVVRKLVPKAGVVHLRSAYRWLQDRRIAKEPDRRFMASTIVPALVAEGARAVLFVGTRSYSRITVTQLAKAGVVIWTSDIDPDAERFGAPGQHRTLDACAMTAKDFPVAFDTILMNGVLGYGVNSKAQCSQSLAAVRSLLPEGGRCILGWNTDRCPDVPRLAAQAGLVPAPLGSVGPQVQFEGSTHVYDFLRAELVVCAMLLCSPNP